MSKLLISKMQLQEVDCYYTALLEGNRLVEFQFEPTTQKSILDNIYVGQVEKVLKNIQGAFIGISPGITCYYNLKEQKDAIYTSHKKNPVLVPGDQLLVQVSTDAMKSKQPAVTTNLSLKGKYLVLTTGKKGLGLSGKLNTEDRERLKKWLSQESLTDYGLVVRTNAKDVSREEFDGELEALKQRYQRLMQYGRSRTCFSVLEKRDEFYLEVLQNVYGDGLEEVITDDSSLLEEIRSYLIKREDPLVERLRFYQDDLLPLIKLYGIEKKLAELTGQKVWLKSGGFLVIQPTEALVSIDVNTGKYISGKKAEESYRKINLEAAEEIAHQLRARNLSGLILIDFINMSRPEHEEELMHVLAKHLRKDPIKSLVHDMTQLKLIEVTRKKVKRPLWESLKGIGNSDDFNE